MKRKIELTEQELNIVLFALQKIAWETANPVIAIIAEQLKNETK